MRLEPQDLLQGKKEQKTRDGSHAADQETLYIIDLRPKRGVVEMKTERSQPHDDSGDRSQQTRPIGSAERHTEHSSQTGDQEQDGQRQVEDGAILPVAFRQYRAGD